jgi:hypothetical protein
MIDLARLRYDKTSPRGHVECWFLKANDPRGRRAIWLEWTVWAGDRAPERAVPEAWPIASGTSGGHVATKTVAPFESARFESRALGVEVDGCALSEVAARGRVESGGRVVTYDLSIAPQSPPLELFPAAFMYSSSLAVQKLSSPVPSCLVSGRVDVGGEHWALDAWPGMIGHNWGRRRARVYGWGQCSVWDGGDDLIFEGFTAARAALGVRAVTVLCLRHQGKNYALNGLTSVARNGGEMTPRRWTFRGAGKGASIEGEIWAETDDLVGLFYPNPDGTMCNCLGSMLAHAEVILELPGQSRRTIRSSRAALEIGTLDARHGVRMYV